MEHDKSQTRQIAVNLDHDAEGVSTLYTRVQHEPDHSSPARKAQNIHNPAVDLLEVTDVGWDAGQMRPEDYALDGIKNEDLWLLVRRFNKRIFHLEHRPDHPDGELDLNVAEEEQFSPNKLRAQVERLYMGVILGLLICKQHIARLRSWREPRRTAAFCLTYFTAWYLNFLMPILWAALIATLLSPKIRSTLFPPCPPSLVHYRNGSLIKPPAGILSTTDSATGAPENFKGETLEREASNFATGIVALSINAFADKDPQHDESQKGGGKTADFPDPRSLATKLTTAKDKAAGVDKPSWDKTKAPMQEIMWSRMRPLMHWICLFCDLWERCGNLLDPTAPFDKDVGRNRIVKIFLPLLILSTYVSCYTIYRTVTLCFGIGFFGSSFSLRIYKWLKLSIARLAVKGVPTDSQLTITLLRQGERNKAPFPPPPVPQGPPLHEPHNDILNQENGDRPLGATQEELQESVDKDAVKIEESGGGDHESCKPGTEGKKRSKLLSVVKPVVSAAAKAIISVDKIRAKTGSETAKHRVGAASPREKPPIAGPVEFTCRWRGERGFVYLTTDCVSPCLCFSKKSSVGDLDNPNYQRVQPEWVIPVADIMTLNKYSGYGTKAKLLAGWALEDAIVDGLEILDNKGQSVLMTAMAHRDELFNRLCAMGNQKWQIW